MSVPNEGLAYYFEEVTLEAGLYDDRPRAREIILELMRLRALRVEADVGLSTGSLSVEEAVDFFARQVPMSKADAIGEVQARLAAPGQGLSYVIGKNQIYDFASAARQVQCPRALADERRLI